jgi:hypothetical protein
MVLVVKLCYNYLNGNSEGLMEFDKNAPISDEQRRLAEAKQITLQPIHADTAPEDESDAEIATRHIVAPAIANVANDTEQTATPAQPSRGLLASQGESKATAGKKRRTGTVLIATVVIAAIAGVIVVSMIIAHK